MAADHSFRFLPTAAAWAQGLLIMACALAAAHAQDHRPKSSTLVYGPYKHLNTGVDPAHPAATTHVSGQPLRLAEAPRDTLLPGVHAVTLAFASGECGQERWKATDVWMAHPDPSRGQALMHRASVDLDAQAVADANVPAFAKAGLPYIISTGGEGNVFTCTTDEGMERFIQRYLSPSLLGFDFDIESTQTLANIQSLVARVKAAQARHPTLRWSFTLPTFAASDASRASLNPLGLQVLATLREAQLQRAYINLMVMDYGAASAAACVVRDARCDMGASALQAARNLHAVHGVPLEYIELTAMIGVNDVVDNVFTLQDAQTLARQAQALALGGLHFWSLDRDTPCPGGATAVASTCSSLNQLDALAFSRAFAQGLR